MSKQSQPKGEIVIDEMLCLGCGCCVEFCPKGCIELPQGATIGPRGYPLPVFVNQEQCNACTVCGWVCPHMAIEVYKWHEAPVTAGVKSNV